MPVGNSGHKLPQRGLDLNNLATVLESAGFEACAFCQSSFGDAS